MKPTAEVSSISNLHIHTSAPWGLVPNHNRQQLVKKLLNGSKCDKRTGPLIKQLSVVSVRIERTLPKRPLEQPEIYLSNNSSQVHINIRLSSHFHNASNTWSLSIPLKVLLGIILHRVFIVFISFDSHPTSSWENAGKARFHKGRGPWVCLMSITAF